MANSTGVKDLEATQTHATGTHSAINNVPRATNAGTEDNAHPTSFPITNR